MDMDYILFGIFINFILWFIIYYVGTSNGRNMRKGKSILECKNCQYLKTYYQKKLTWSGVTNEKQKYCSYYYSAICPHEKLCCPNCGQNNFSSGPDFTKSTLPTIYRCKNCSKTFKKSELKKIQ